VGTLLPRCYRGRLLFPAKHLLVEVKPKCPCHDLKLKGTKAVPQELEAESRHQGRFEAGRVRLPVEAPWLADFESELLAFPNGRYDDQVDAFMLFLDWFSGNEQYLIPPTVFPILVIEKRPDPFAWCY
jgi:hypothetical protein